MSDNSPETPEPAAKHDPETPSPAEPSPTAAHHDPAAEREAEQPETAEPAGTERPASAAGERFKPADGVKPTRKRRGPPVAVVALVALLVGAGATFGGLWFAGWRQVPEEKYTMVVILKDGTSQQQKDEIQKVLETLPQHSAVRLVGKAEAFAEAQKAYASQPEALAGLKEESMPESFRLSVVERDFDCTPLKPLGGNTAITKMSVVKPYVNESNPGADVLC
ncbi:permease-like cell division protein FtsX [Actinoplanes sp. HUAS TT8]|uniref:permease-like cell division protein FtsX n=1 Tax=Actinoplanes sp. HUAS TT8 TaxID=3447453 RepID=UPI003F51C613